jgi:hypothetical protein
MNFLPQMAFFPGKFEECVLKKKGICNRLGIPFSFLRLKISKKFPQMKSLDVTDPDAFIR